MRSSTIRRKEEAQSELEAIEEEARITRVTNLHYRKFYEDELENDQRVGECVQKKTEHWVHITVAELAALETIIIVVAVVIIIIIIIKYDIIIRFIIKSDTF